jgi:hypothetical protein
MIIEQRCKTKDQFKTIIFSYIRQSEHFGLSSDNDYVDNIWRDIIEKECRFYNKYGYIDVVFDFDANIFYRKKKRGRPVYDDLKDSRVTVRLSEEQLNLLDKYCKENDLAEKSEAIRMAIDNLIGNNKKEIKDVF